MEVYKIYNDDIGEHVATIYYNKETDKFTSELIIPKETPIVFADCSRGGIHLGECPHPESIYLENWLKMRVIPENRMFIKEILQAHGIYKYDWRVLIKLNHGKTVEDNFRVEVEEI